MGENNFLLKQVCELLSSKTGCGSVRIKNLYVKCGVYAHRVQWTCDIDT